jgi:hypothetical protein
MIANATLLKPNVACIFLLIYCLLLNATTRLYTHGLVVHCSPCSLKYNRVLIKMERP